MFNDHELAIYDPPLGFGTIDDLSDTDFVVVCVPTPQLPSGDCDTSIVEEVVGLSDPRVAIVCHSTVAIGTTERIITETGKRLVFMPEYGGRGRRPTPSAIPPTAASSSTAATTRQPQP